MLSFRFLTCAAWFCAFTALTPVARAETGTISRNFTFVSQFGGSGSGAGQLSLPEDMAIGPDGHLYVVDRFNSRIQIFDRQGNYLSQFGSGGIGPGQFNNPYGITFNTNGDPYISELSTNRVQIFDSSHTVIGSFGSAGFGPGEFSNTTGVTHDASGNIYVADAGGGRIQVFNSAGVYQRQFGSGLLNFPIDIGMSPSGVLYVADYMNGRVVSFDAATGTMTGVFMSHGAGAGQTTSPIGIDIDSFGNVYVSDIGSARIQVMAPDGTVLATYSNPGAGPGQFSSPRNVLAGGDGLIYVGDDTTYRVLIYSLLTTETFSASPAGGDEHAALPGTTLELANTGSFAHDFIGYDNLQMNGTAWTLSGNNTFTTAVDINSGVLTNNGTITAPNTTVVNGATLSGTGTFISNVSSDGTMAPGNGAAHNIGTLHITGNYAETADATYQLDIDNTGHADALAVDGTVSLNGGTVTINAAPGTYNHYALYTILTATNGVTGTFGTLNGDLAFLSPHLVYNPNDVQLTWGTNNLTFADYTSTPNGAATAKALDVYQNAGFNGDTQAQNALAVLTPEQAKQFIAQMTPDEIAQLPSIQVNITHQMQQPLLQRLSDLMPPDGQQSFALLSPAAGGTAPKDAWVQALGGVTNNSGGTGFNGYRDTVVGTRAGIDRALSADTTIGISGALAQDNTAFSGGGDKAQTTYGHGDLYALHRLNDTIFSGFLGAGGGRLHTSRFIAGGGLDRKAYGATGVYDLSATAKVEQIIRTASGVAFIPSLTASGGWYRQNAFTESGAGSLNLHIDDTHSAPITFSPMLETQKTFTDAEKDFHVTPSFGIGATWYAHDRDNAAHADFAESSGGVPGFSVDSLGQKPLALNLRAGVTLEPFDSSLAPSFTAQADSAFTSQASSYSATLQLTWNW